MTSLRFTLLAAALALAVPATATPNAQIVRTFQTELPALAQFGSPQALCSAVDPTASGQVAARAPARAKQMVRVECPGFFTHQPTSASVPNVGGARVPVTPD